MVAIFCHLACPEAVVQTEHVGDRHLGEREAQAGMILKVLVISEKRDDSFIWNGGAVKI